MAVVINYSVAGARYGSLSVCEGTSIKKLREILNTLGYNVDGCSIRLWRGKDPEDEYIGHLDDFTLTAEDTVVFYNEFNNVTVEADSTITLDKRVDDISVAPKKNENLKEQLEQLFKHLDAAREIIINNL